MLKELKAAVRMITMGAIFPKSVVSIIEEVGYVTSVEVKIYNTSDLSLKGKEKMVRKFLKDVCGKGGKNLVPHILVETVEGLEDLRTHGYCSIEQNMLSGYWVNFTLSSSEVITGLQGDHDHLSITLPQTESIYDYYQDSIRERIASEIANYSCTNEDFRVICPECGSVDLCHINCCWDCESKGLTNYFPNVDFNDSEEVWKLFKGFVLADEPKKKFLPKQPKYEESFNQIFENALDAEDLEIEETTKVEAIKAIRRYKGIDLKESKAIVDEVWNDYEHENEDERLEEYDRTKTSLCEESSITIGEMVKQQVAANNG